MKFRDLFARKKKPPEGADSSAPPALPGGGSTLSFIDEPPLPDGSDSLSVTGNELQKTVNQTATGSVLALDVSRGEYEGPIVIKKPITIDGNGHSIWAKKGPVVIIKSQGVVLKNLQVEVTGNQAKLTDVELCSLAVQPEAKPTLESVTVRGDVVGLEGEEGAWGYPTAINMGSLKANVSHTFKLSLLVPVPCRFSCDISGVSLLPGGVSGGGMAALTLKIDHLAAGTRLRGSILIKSGALVRRIAVGANVARTENAAAIVGDGTILWQPPAPEPPTEKSTSSQKTRKAEAKKPKVKKTAAKKVSKKKSAKKKVAKKTTKLPKGKKKKPSNVDTGVPAKDGKNDKSRNSKEHPIPAHLPEESPKPTHKPVVPDENAQAFKKKDTAKPSSKPQPKKTNTRNKKSGVPTGGAFAKVPVKPVKKTAPEKAPTKTTAPAPTKQKKVKEPPVEVKKPSKVPAKSKVKPQKKGPRKPRKSTVVKSDFAGGAFASQPKETTTEQEPAKKKPVKKGAPASKKTPKKKEAVGKPPIKKKPANRVQSKGLGSVWGEAKKKK